MSDFVVKANVVFDIIKTILRDNLMEKRQYSVFQIYQNMNSGRSVTAKLRKSENYHY